MADSCPLTSAEKLGIFEAVMFVIPAPLPLTTTNEPVVAPIFVTPVKVVTPLVIELVRATVTAPVDALADKFEPAVNEVTAEPPRLKPVKPEPSPIKLDALTTPITFTAPVIFTEPVN